MALLTVPAAAALLIASTDAGRQAVARAVAQAASVPGEATLRLGRIDGSLLGAFAIDMVTVADRDGVWLTVENARVDWSPLALLGGRLSIEAVEVARIVAARAPLPAEAPAAPRPVTLPSLPLDVALRRLALDRVELGAAVLGAPAAVAVRGDVSGQAPQTVAARLDVRRLDGADGAVKLDATLRGGDRFLSVKLDAHEPAGGLLARLLHLPELPQVDVTLAGEGPVDDWRGALAASLDGLYRADATLLLAGTATPTLTIDGTGTAARTFGAPPWALLNGRTTVRLTADWNPDTGTAGLRALEATGAAWRATANGAVKTADLTGTLIASVAVTDAAALAPLAGGAELAGLTAQLQARGGIDAIDATVQVSAPTVRQGDIAVDGATATLRLQGAPTGTLQLDGGGRIAGIAVPGLPAAYVEGGIDWQAQATLAGTDATVDSLRVAGKLAQVAGSGRADLAAGDVSADLAITVPDLAPFAPLQGGATANVAALLSDFGRVFAADVEGRVAATSADPAVAAALGRETTLSASMNGTLDGEMSVQRLRVATPTVVLTAAANIGDSFRQVSARYEIAVASLAPFAPVAGSAHLAGTAQGPLDALDAAGRISLADVAVAALRVPTATVDYKLAGLPAAPRGGIAAAARTPVGDVTARTSLALQGDHLQLAGIDVAVAGGGTVTGDLRLPLDGAPAAGALRAQAAKLAPFLALAGLQGDGAASGTVTLADVAGRQGAGVDARIDNLALVLGGETLAVRAATLRVDGADLVKQRVETLALAVEAAAFGERRVDRLTVDATGTPTAMRFAAHADGQVDGALDLDARGEVALGDDGVALTLASLTGTAAGEAVRLAQPMVLRQAPARLAMAGLDLRFGPARLAGDAVLGANEVAIDLALSDLDIGKLKRRTGGIGQVAATVKVDGVGAAQRGTILLTARDVGLADLPEAGPASADIAGTLAGGRLSLDGRIGGLGSAPFAFTGAVPLALGGPDLVALAPDAPIEGAADWQGEVGELWLFVPLPTHLLKGQGTVRARVGGTLASPRLDGEASLANGRYESLDAGTIVANLEVQAVLAGDHVELRRFSGTDGGAGTLDAAGKVTLPQGERALAVALNATLRNFTAVRRDELVGSLGGTAEVTLQGDRAQVTARLATEAVEVRIPDRLPLSVAELDVRDAAAPPPAAPPPPAVVAGLDVAVELPRRVYVRGRGLDSEWQGKVTVTGTSAAPDVRGELTLVRGTLALLGKDFTLSNGRVLLPGGPTPDPQINVTATHQASELTVAVRVTGSATNPDFTLTSVPALPQDEILAQLFFGKSATQLSALEAAQLAAAIGELTGVTSGPSIIDRVRTSLGIDVLKVEGGADGTSRVAAGAYVTRNVLVGVKQGAAAGSGAVSVEVEVTDYLSLESEVKQSGATSLGVKLEWDY